MARFRRDTILRKLKEARKLILNKKNWITCYVAQRPTEDDYEDFVETNPSDPKAVKFCATGAISKACKSWLNGLENVYYSECIKRVALALPERGRGLPKNLGPDLDPEDKIFTAECSDEIQELNDVGGIYAHRRVIASFDRAIKTLEKELAKK